MEGRDRTVITGTVELPHPPEDVFAAVMSPEIAPQIDPAVRRWEPDRRPIGIGTTFEIRGWFQWLPIRGTSRVTEWDPPHRGVFESIRPIRPLRVLAVHELEPDGAGTRYTWSQTFFHDGRVGRLAARVITPLVARTIADQHRTLAAWLDAHPGASGFAQL
ncbi:MAG TPA: SRPBCC family protein [Acidimicrobiales bacterium]|nr:SRPBCC family protein [Acidimicrobiales bacterium]